MDNGKPTVNAPSPSGEPPTDASAPVADPLESDRTGGPTPAGPAAPPHRGPQATNPESASGSASIASPSHENLSEDDLIDAALGGDRPAFGELTRRHEDRLYNCLLRLTGSPEDARDIAQDALIQALVKLDRFRRDSAFFTWLYRIAFNRAVSVGRKRRERVSLDGLQQATPAAGERRRDTTMAEPVSNAPRPDAPLLADERATLVHRALATLADEHRQVLVLREFEGLDYGQIAAIVQTPVGTVRSRLFRARSQLRTVLCSLGLGE